VILPIDELIKNQGNMYELACAAIKRVVQLNESEDEEVLKSQKKIVSLALKQILTKNIEYRLEE